MSASDMSESHPKTLSVPEVGRRYFGLGRGASYAAAARGEIPTIRLGRLLRAPVVAVERMLEEAGNTAAAKRRHSTSAPTQTESARGTR
jgi:hypothetical protein